MKRNKTTTKAAPAPAVLLAEDDAVSAEFLATSMESLGCAVTLEASGESALAAALAQPFDFLLIDRNLPRLGAAELLQQLRGQADAASRTAPAVASSAEWDEPQRARMRAVGYAEVLAKPCNAGQLRRLLEHYIDAAAWPVSHDHSARQAAGSQANLEALRRLFAMELRQWDDDLPALCGHRRQLIERMHRLCASAGFCGAPGLAAACRQWLAQLRADENSDVGRQAFEQALQSARSRFV